MDMEHEIKGATPAQPIADMSAPADLSKRLLEMANNTSGQHSAVSVLKAELIALCCETNRYYGGMMAWKQTAEKKDADWNAERMGRVNDRIAARAAAPVSQPTKSTEGK